MPQTWTRARFADFELDLDAGELRKGGARASIPEQPLRLLEELLEHPGVIVSREQLRAKLWPADTFVDFEHGLNAAVKRLRDVLGDSADQPRFIETVPKRGYRFIAPIDSDVADTIRTKGRGARRRVWAGAAAFLLLIAGGVGWWLLVQPGEDPAAAPASSRLRRLTFDARLQTDPAFSPNGRFMAYASNVSGNFDIWIQDLASGAATRLTDDPRHDTQPDWSPDGRSILFRSERDGGGLFVISPQDRHVTRLTSFGYSPRWSPDGKSFAFGSGVFGSGTTLIASADGAGLSPVAYQNTPGQLNRAIGWHPSGRLVWLSGSGADIAMVSRRDVNDPPRTSAIADGVRRRFKELELGIVDNQRLVWSSDKRTLHFVGRAQESTDIWRMSVDPVALSVVDGPVRVTTGAETESALAIAPDDGLAFNAATRTSRAWVMDLDARGWPVEGSAKPVTSESLTASEPVLRPDGRRLVVRIDHPGGDRRPELREFSLEDSSERVLRTIDLTREDIRFPRWSPDSTRLAYRYVHFGKDAGKYGFASAIKVLDVRSLQESLVTSPWSDGTPALENPWGWAADGTSLIVGSTRYRPGVHALARLPLSAAPRAETAARILVAAKAGAGLWEAFESPDGRWVSYNQTPLPGHESSVLHLVPAGGGEPLRLLDGTSWDDKPRWSANGRLLYFISLRGGDLNVWAVKVDARDGTAIGQPFQVTRYGEVAETISDQIGAAELSVEGSRMALLVQRLAGGIWVLQ